MRDLRAALRERVRDADVRVGWFAFEGYRVRWSGDRFYFLEVQEGAQYLQDVWPETDAMLAVLEGAAPGRFLDVGTGCGIVAIEAAARGHSVVATDLFDTALEVARFNARLNEVAIEFRRGHLFEPVLDEKFDLILTAPHYGQLYDQLRCEVLRDGPRRLTATGKLVLATQLELEDEKLGVECLLRPLAETMKVRVQPIVAAHKRAWFKFADSDPDFPVEKLVARARFTVAVEAAGPGELSIEMPSRELQPTEIYVPLSRLRENATHPISAALVAADDVARLGAILRALEAPDCTIDVPMPSGFLDGCRVGEKFCLGKGGAAAAIVDVEGGVRPCTHSPTVARADDTEAAVRRRFSVLQREAEARRGCAECPAREECSRCLATGPFGDGYCDFIRAHAAALPRFHRLVQTLRHLPAGRPPIRVLRLGDRFAARETWVVQVDVAHLITYVDGKKLWVHEVDALTAALAERLAGEPDALERHQRELQLPARLFEQLQRRLENFQF